MIRANTEFEAIIRKLTSSQQKKVLEFAQSLALKSTSKSNLLSLFGSISKEDAQKMRDAIEDAFEKTNPDDWQ
jgi:GTP-binding protein EngB required for normal cell division